MGGSCLKQSNHTGSLKQTLKLYGTIANSTSSYKHMGTYTMSNVMDSANGKLDPSVYGELGYPKNPKRNRGRSRGRVQGVHTPPPEMTCGFLIQLGFCKKI